MKNSTSVTRRPTQPAALARRTVRPRRPTPDWRFRRHLQPAEARAGGVAQDIAARRRVLVVDDEPAIRALCRVNLSVSGMDVIEAADGETALELARTEN